MRPVLTWSNSTKEINIYEEIFALTTVRDIVNSKGGKHTDKNVVINKMQK